MNIVFDIIYLVALLIAVVIIWRALWNLMDQYIPNTTRINVIILVVAIIFVAVLRYLSDINAKKNSS
ncbi:MAG: hypothetical protein Satyrvirus26_7 [Satyrvirus sp.]|uniref:Uncharacterized protein n=1 Tax=Satyrvirus sp. TaxID=2487771 RepID=A0A3G5AEQ6_9VIRU|nr:MAG: hypothetical protein Satyrvirus26_7 [Satyrvirus sp.]